jgi:hypothetical protein
VTARRRAQVAAGPASKNGRMEPENYGNELIALTDITLEEKKKD